MNMLTQVMWVAVGSVSVVIVNDDVGTVKCTTTGNDYTLHNVQCTMYSVQCTMYTVHCTVYTVD